MQYVFFVNTNHSGDHTVPGTVCEYNALRCFFFVNPNHSHNGNMVKDMHAKACAFMANMKFTDSCMGYDAGVKSANVLSNFLVKRSHQVMPRIFSNISFELWNEIGDDDDEEMMKEKVIDFLNPFHVVMNKKDFFCCSSDKGSVFCD